MTSHFAMGVQDQGLSFPLSTINMRRGILRTMSYIIFKHFSPWCFFFIPALGIFLTKCIAFFCLLPPNQGAGRDDSLEKFEFPPPRIRGLCVPVSAAAGLDISHTQPGRQDETFFGGGEWPPALPHLENHPGPRGNTWWMPLGGLLVGQWH